MADVAVVKAVEGTAAPGAPITWNIEVENHGPSPATDVTLTDTLPNAVTDPTGHIKDGAPCTTEGRRVTCTLGTLPAGDKVSLHITGVLTPTATGKLTNTATANSTTNDPHTNNNTATSRVWLQPVAQSADVAVTKAVEGTATPGAQITWNIEVENHGPSPATDVTLTDTLPNAVTDPTGHIKDGAPCTTEGRRVTCTLGTLPAGDKVSLHITGVLTPTATGKLTNTATANSTTNDPHTNNNTATSRVRVAETPVPAPTHPPRGPMPATGPGPTFIMLIISGVLVLLGFSLVVAARRIRSKWEAEGSQEVPG
ncbi:DUF11 domain-containing protein [Streptomyces sp. NPDC050658]|uniref:DUF11 domain-containing protein n=1 Tax=unclassified Streptomyces TaxID=2593676 RepID=UPI00343CEB52